VLMTRYPGDSQPNIITVEKQLSTHPTLVPYPAGVPKS